MKKLTPMTRWLLAALAILTLSAPISASAASTYVDQAAGFSLSPTDGTNGVWDSTRRLEIAGYQGVALAVNYPVETNSAAGNPVAFQPQGTDATIGVQVQAKGATGSVQLGNISATTNTITATGVASEVNGITVTGSATGTAPSIAATGTDSTMGLALQAKGATTSVNIGNAAATTNTLVATGATSQVNGVTVTGSATAVAPTILATGTDSNIGLTIGSKGTGVTSVTNNAITSVIPNFLLICDTQNQVAAASYAVSHTIFLMPNTGESYKLQNISEVHGTASTSGTIQIEVATGTQAIASGVNQLTGTMSNAGTANTTVNGTLIGSPNTIAAGSRLNLIFAGTQTNLLNGEICVALSKVS